MNGKRIVITGTGTVNALGNSVKETWEKASNGVSGIDRITNFDASHLQIDIAGEVKNFDYKEHFSEDTLKKAKRMDKFVHFAFAAANQAISQSGLEVSKEAERIGMCVSSGMGGMQAQHDNSAALATKGARRVSPFYVPAAIGNIAAGLLSMEYGMKGPNLSLQTACATSNHSLISAFMIIQSGMADVMIAGGSEAAVIELGVAGFANMQALSTHFRETPQKASRPYDVDRDGFVIAEGAGVLVVEEYEHAKARGAEILCELKAVGMSGDGYDLVMPDPEGRGAYRSMQMALDNAKLPSDVLNYVNTHGTSTPLGDIAESKAVKMLLGDNEENCHVGSTKSMHGHILGATAAVEGIITIEAMRNGVVPPSINIDNFDPQIPLSCINSEPIEKEIKYAISNSFGFGGHNSTVMFASI
ncbi:MAG: beta-ketoacyl-ACP synthase II [Spirochaetales bacterium]|nr:beta-ketoacyl-ACP synthase II [Spirochaetales bacterium]